MQPKRKPALAFLILAVLVPVLVMSQPGGGGATFIPTFSYHHPSTFFLRCDMTGAYLTRDGGKHYQQINFPGGVQSFAFDPTDEKIIYAASVALYRSTDSGITWRSLYPRPEQVRARTYAGDHAELSLTVDPATSYWAPGQTIRTIRVDAVDHRRVCFTAGSSLFYSFDGGGAWKEKKFPRVLEYVYADAGHLILFSADSLYTLDRQMQITGSRAYPSAVRFAAGVLKNTARPILYALRRDGRDAVWVSTDLGRHWASAPLPAGASVSALACAEYDAARIYVVADRVVQRKGNDSAIFYGVFHSADAGVHWHWVWKAGGGSGQYGVPDAQNPSNLADGWAGKAFGKEFVQVMDIGVAPRDGNTAVVTDWYRVMKTVDGGHQWTSVYSQNRPGGAAVSTGLDVTTTYGVHFDPHDPKHIAVSCTDIGYHHSFDGGKSWVRSVAGLPAEWVNTCYWVAFDPVIPNKCWSAWSGVHDLPRGKMTRDPHWKDHCHGGIGLSLDGGRSWTPVLPGLGSVTSIVIDPHSPPGRRTLYATVYNKGLFKSIDDGRNWTLHNNGIGANTCAFEVTLAGNGDLYLVVSPTPDHHSTDHRFYSGALYKSADGAGSWQLLHPVPGADTLFPSGVGVDPLDPQRLYLACWSAITLGDLYGSVVRKAGVDGPIPTPGGIYRSEDGGRSWTSVLGREEYVYDVTVDVHHPGRVFANTFTGKALRSDDYGNTWKSIHGYNFQWGHRVLVDEADPEKIYLTTYGSGIWHGTAETDTTLNNDHE